MTSTTIAWSWTVSRGPAMAADGTTSEGTLMTTERKTAEATWGRELTTDPVLEGLERGV